MDVIIKLNNQSNGRDKLVRLAQYTSRLIWHQLELSSANKYTVDRIRNLEVAFSNCRRILRFGRCIDALYSVLDSLKITDQKLRATVAGGKIFHSLYLYADHVVWLARSGLLNADSHKWNLTANKFWLLSILMNLLRDIHEILILLNIHKVTLSKALYEDKGLKIVKLLLALGECHKGVFIDTFKNLCDLFIPMTFLGYTKLSPSVVGILGATSSMAAIFTMIKPITKL